MRYLSNFFIAIDQLGNVLAGGNPDNTISSRVGYYTEVYYSEDKVPLKWELFRSIIDSSFYPIDGVNHCKEAYYNDAGEDFDPDTSDIAIAFLAIIIIAGCVFISIVLYTLYAFRLVNPKKINRTKNIKHRLRTAEMKLRGILTELNMYNVEVDLELNEIIEDTDERIEDIAQKITGVLELNKRLTKYKSTKA